MRESERESERKRVSERTRERERETYIIFICFQYDHRVSSGLHSRCYLAFLTRELNAIRSHPDPHFLRYPRIVVRTSGLSSSGTRIVSRLPNCRQSFVAYLSARWVACVREWRTLAAHLSWPTISRCRFDIDRYGFNIDHALCCLGRTSEFATSQFDIAVFGERITERSGHHTLYASIMRSLSSCQSRGVSRRAAVCPRRT